MISFQHVSKQYQDFYALKDISFELKPGEIFGYIGPNGAGKTTTIKIMVGLITQFSGTFIFDQKPMPQQFAQVSAQLGYLPQAVSFQQWRTVKQMLTTLGRLSGMQDVQLDKRILSLMELFGLKDVADKKITRLSGGMVQKIGLIQALLQQPRLLVLDEPLSGLDPASRLQVKSILKQLSCEGTTIFLSSHILSDVQDIADRIGILKSGQIKIIGTVYDLKSKLLQSNIVEISFFTENDSYADLINISGVDRVEKLSPTRVALHINHQASGQSVYLHIQKYLSDRNIPVLAFQNKAPDLDEVYLEFVK